MKKIVMLFISFVFLLNLMAQKKIDLSEFNIEQLNHYKEKAVKIENTGMILTFVGGAVAIISGTLSFNEFLKPPPDYDPKKESIFGFIMLSGIVTTGVGIPLWITGDRRKSKAEIALKKFDVKTNNSMAIGLGLTIRF